MLAEQMGYGTGDEGIAKMTEDLEKGAIASNEAIAALLAGMKKYDGMMDSMANETVEGLWSQIQDTFEINVFRKWGQGLQDGAKKGFGTLVQLLDEAEEGLSEFGDMLYEIGQKASNWLADKFQNAVDRILKITGSFEFKNADLGEKISMLWKGVIVDPLKEWWEGGGQQKTAETAGKIGTWMGEMLTKGILALLGVTDIFADSGLSEEGGMSVAQSFAKGFAEAFDVSAITDKLVEAIGNVWNALPTWAKVLVGGYGIGKAAGGIGNFIGGVANFAGMAKNFIGHGATVDAAGNAVKGAGLIGMIGKTGSYVAAGSGILGGLSSLGYGAVGKLSGAGALGMTGLSGGLATGAGLGLLTAGAGAIYSGHQFLNAYQLHKDGHDTAAKASFARGAGTSAGLAAGALAGAKIGAGVGTLAGPVGTAVGGLIGAGLGTVVGWFAGDKIARNIEAAKFESLEMQKAVKDSETSAEEMAMIFEQAKWENAKEHFGDIELSMEEISRLANQIVWGDDIGIFEELNTAVSQAEASMQALNNAGEQTHRWMWKAGLGVKFNDDEIATIESSFDDYISSAKAFVEDKQYEFTAAVKMLVDIDTEEGKTIIESGNAYFAEIQEKLNNLGEELSTKVEIALEDGVITLDEQAEIINLQKQIEEITSKLADAETEAELELIKIKFGEGNLELETFETFMQTMNTTIQNKLNAADTAFTKAVSVLKLELKDGAITQEQYDEQLKELIEGYKTEVEQVKVDIMGVELEIIGEAYTEELGADAAADLQKTLEYCLNEGIDPVELEADKLFELLGVDSLGEETAANIKEMLSGVFGQLELLEVDGDLLLKIGSVTVEEGTEEQVKQKVDEQTPDTLDESVLVNITPEEVIQSVGEILGEDFNIPPSIAETVALKLNAAATVQEKVEILASEFGISEEEATSILWKISGYKRIRNQISVTAGDFGLPSSINHTVTVNITGDPKFRGGLVGGSTTTGGESSSGGSAGNHTSGKFARGGIAGKLSRIAGNIPGFSDGGMVRGGSQLIEVAEEGSPEMIIPLSSQRRGRALKLWAQAGNIMGVPGFARGGIIGGDGSRDEGIRFYNDNDDSSAGGQTVQIEVGGITVEIHVNAANMENIAEAIKAQASEIADTVAGIMADAIGGQFQNMPVRGGT